MVRKRSDSVFDRLHKVVKRRREEGHFGKRPKKIEKKVPKHILKKQLKKEKTWWDKYKKEAAKLPNPVEALGHYWKREKEAAIREIQGMGKKWHKPEAAKKQPAHEDVFDTLKIRDIAAGRTEKKTAFLDFFTRAKSKEIKKKVENKIIYDFFRKSKKKEPPKILSLIKTRPAEEPKFKIPIAPEELTKKIIIDTIMSRNPISVDISAPIEEVLSLILKYNIRGVPVTQNGKVVGIIEEDDIINYFEKRIPMSEGAIRLRHKEIDELSERPISELHPKRLVILSPNDSLEKAIKALYETDIGRICVMEEDKLVGLVTRDDVVKALMKSTISMHIITSEVMHTDIDRLLEFIEEKGRVTIDEASEKLKVDRQMIEEWAAILEEHALITVEYPVIGTVELVKKEE